MVVRNSGNSEGFLKYTDIRGLFGFRKGLDAALRQCSTQFLTLVHLKPIFRAAELPFVLAAKF